jgi:hypothetical protein
MHPSEGLDFIRQSAPIALPGRTVSGDEGVAVARPRGILCPFGCGPERHDDKGFCHHLEGFTDGHQEKNSNGELVTVYERTRKTADPRTGAIEWRTGEQKQVKEDDGGIQEFGINRVLQPEDIVVHLNNGKSGKAFAGTQWARVYRPRKPGETPVFRPGTSQTPDLSQLQKVLEVLQARDKKKDKIIAKLMEAAGVDPDSLDLDL